MPLQRISDHFAADIAKQQIPKTMKNNLIGLITIASCVTLGMQSANGAAIIHESFNQSDGALGGQAGGTGLSGNWSTNQTVNVENPSTINHGSLVNEGGQAVVNSGNNTWASITTTSALADAGLLDNGSTLWFSYVFVKQAGASSNEHAGFAFGTDRVDPAFNGLRMDDGEGLGVYTQGSNIRARGWEGSDRSNGSNLNVDFGDPTKLVIGRIDWGATAADDETITIWLGDLDNPGILPMDSSTTTTGPLNQTDFDTVSFGQRNSGEAQIYDEIRFGATLDSVSPIPEPTTALLGGLGFLMLMRRRR